jgi:hypothetical protein
MLALLAVWVTTSTAAAADGLELPPWPPGMRAEVRPDGWTCLSPATSDATHERLERLDRFPQLCLEIIDTRVREALAVSNELHQVDLADQAAHISKLEQNQMTPGRVAKIGGFCLVVGAAAALILERVLHKGDNP